MFFSPEHH